MPKLTLDTLLSKFASITKLNNNFSLISTAIDNTLSRDGTAPNAMGADLDMNSNKIINLPAATTDKEPATKKQLDDAALGSVDILTLDVKGQTAKTHFILKSRTTTAQPASPVEGDHYLIPTGATGADWSGFTAGNLAAFVGGVWLETPVEQGFTGTILDEAGLFVFLDPLDTGGLEVSTGSAVSPSLTFEMDTDTGLYNTAADQVSIAAGGIEMFRVKKRTDGKTEIGVADLFDNFVGGQHVAGFMFDSEKTYVRSLMIAEEADTPDLAIRRMNGTLTVPTPVLVDELIGVLYWQPWLGDPRGWGTGVSPNEGRSAMLFSRLTDPASGSPDFFSGGSFSIGTTPHGAHAIQERFWIHNDGSAVLAGAARSPNGLIDSTSSGFNSQRALFDIYSPDDATRPCLALRHDDSIFDGFTISIAQASNELIFKRLITDVPTEILRLDGNGIQPASIGIGTPAPSSQKLVVVGSSQFGNATDGLIIDGSTGAFSVSNASYIRRDSGTGDLNIVASSNVAGRKVVIEKKAGDADLVIDTNATTIKGTVLKPQQPAFMAFNSVTNADVTGTGTFFTVEFDTEDFDQGGDYNNTTDIFTAPVTGVYDISAYVTLTGVTSSATRAGIQLVTTPRVFTREKGDPQPDVNTRVTVGINTLVKLAAGQTAIVKVVVEGEVADTVDVLGDATNPVTWFSARLVA